MARKLVFKLIFISALLLLPLTSAFADDPQKAQETQPVQEQSQDPIDLILGIPVIGGVGACIVAYNNKRRQKTKNQAKKTIETNMDL